MAILHQMQISGNCYKVRLAAHQLGIPLTLKEYPVFAGDTRRPEFLSKIRTAACRFWNSTAAAAYRNPAPSFGI